ncbi:uncharacterized protein LOC141641652 [Silene latifolia]|uniref:uncharacterized protein LOC141641652 n=1 Tax=Silene latifolia TaxID=37657 RepID=UPI003D77CB71
MGVIDRIKALCRNFLWEGGEGYSKAPLVAWSTLFKGKEYGGLGLIYTKLWNVAAVGKIVWWIAKKKDHLWIQWVDKIYMKHVSWRDYKPTYASSWAWRKICEVKETFKMALNQGKWMAATEDYTISAGYDWLTQHNSLKVPWDKSVCNRFNIPKHSFILWLIYHGRLLTLDRLVKMGITQQLSCFLCGTNDETHYHLFHDCCYTKLCLTQLSTWLNIQLPGQITTASILKMKRFTRFPRLVISSLVAAVHCQVWYARNTCRHEGYVSCPVALISKVKTECRFRLLGLDTGTLKREDIDWCKQRELM